MKTMAFASRNAKEILRDKTTLGFGIGFPVILLLLLSLIGANAPVDLFDVDKLTPGIAVFGMSFISLFSGMIIAKDRSSSFMMRLFASPIGLICFLDPAGYGKKNSRASIQVLDKMNIKCCPGEYCPGQHFILLRLGYYLWESAISSINFSITCFLTYTSKLSMQINANFFRKSWFSSSAFS